MSTVHLDQYSKPRVLFMKVAVLCIFLMKAVSVINVVLGNIKETFPDTDPALISAIGTVPVVFMFIMSLLSGKITQKFDKKKVLIAALVIFIVAGVGNFFLCSSIYQILFMRGLLGVGAGLSAPLTGAIIADLFDGKERTQMLGFANAVGSIITSGLQYVAGVLAVSNWKYAFFTYGLFILVLIIELLALPSLPPVEKQSPKEGVRVRATSGEKMQYALVFLFCFFYLMIQMLYNMKQAMYIMGNGLGDSALVGSAMSVQTLVAFLLGLAFAPLTKALGRFTLPLCCLITSACFAVLLLANSSAMVMVAGIVSGLQMGLVTPTLQMKALSICPPGGNTTVATSMVTCGLFGGQIVATPLELFLRSFGIVDIPGLFRFGLVACLILCVFAVIWNFVLDKRFHGESSC